MICLLRKLLNYKHYNLRGDVIVTTDGAGNVLSQSYYEAYGEHKDSGAMPSDKHRANTKVEDADTNLLLEGHRYRLLGAGVFLSPDPLEYVDGLHRYAYCGFNPWGRFDPTGLQGKIIFEDSFTDDQKKIITQAHSKSIKLAKNSIEKLKNIKNDKSVQIAYEDSFGGINPKGISTVEKILKSTLKELEKDITIRKPRNKDFKSERSKESVVAYVLEHVESTIFINDPFYELPDDGFRSKGGAILHEGTHETKKTSDFAYGKEADRLPHRESIYNADSYSRFAERLEKNSTQENDNKNEEKNE